MPDHVVGRRGIVLLAACAASAALALAAMGATLIYRAHVNDEIQKQTTAQCRALETVKGAIRLVFSDQLAELERRRKSIDETQYRIARDYYQRQLDRFQPKGCP